MLTTNIGAEDIVLPEQTGMHFETGNAEHLANKVALPFDDRATLIHMGEQARTLYEQEHTAKAER